MRVLITGASGFLGRHLCKALAERDNFVVELWRDLNNGQPNPFDIKKAIGPHSICVFGSFEQVERAIAEYECEAVVHLAAQVQVSTAVSDPVGTMEANVRGTWTVLEACRRQKVKRVIVSSSDKAYGDGPSPYFEHQPLLPSGIYATSKACQDMIASAYAREYKMSIATTRAGNLYGPSHTNFSTLIPGTIRSVLKGERPRLRSNGKLKRDYLYVGDAVDGYLRLLDSEVTGAFNFGTGRPRSVLEVVDCVLTACKSTLLPVFEVPLSQASEIESQSLDWSRAQKLLKWEPTQTLESGLEGTVKWYRRFLGHQLDTDDTKRTGGR